MAQSDLSVIVAELQRKGYDARTLGREGIVVWVGSKGEYFPADRREELRQRYLSPPARNPAVTVTADSLTR